MNRWLPHASMQWIECIATTALLWSLLVVALYVLLLRMV
jgi:hypothetical protein